MCHIYGRKIGYLYIDYHALSECMKRGSDIFVPSTGLRAAIMQASHSMNVRCLHTIHIYTCSRKTPYVTWMQLNPDVSTPYIYIHAFVPAIIQNMYYMIKMKSESLQNMHIPVCSCTTCLADLPKWNETRLSFIVGIGGGGGVVRVIRRGWGMGDEIDWCLRGGGGVI